MLRLHYLLVALTAALPTAARGETLVGPVPARVERVVDGDTLAVRARIWLGQDVHVLVRLRGLDAPELRGACERERALAQEAAEILRSTVDGVSVELGSIETDKYGGRVVADVSLPDGRDLAGALLAVAPVRRYSGGRRLAWCGM